MHRRPAARPLPGLAAVLCLGLAGAGALPAPAGGGDGPPLFTRWQTFTTAHGLPSDKVFALAAEPGRLWVGTEEGLALYAAGAWSAFGTDAGLAYPVITSLASDPATGDLWVGTLGGLSRLSGGRFESFDQLNSGLANDVVYGVAVEGRHVWAATAAGTSRLDTWTGSWEVFTNRNAPMHEIWCYGVAAADGKVHLAVWGGGVLQYDLERRRWREFRDPDGEMELDLLRDDGPVSDVVASVAYGGGILWAGTYFGVNRYDGRRWLSYSVADSGLASDFVNTVIAEGSSAWFGTDDGLSHFDGTTWTTYRADPERSGGGTIAVRDPAGERLLDTAEGLADSFVLAVARRGDELWVGTEKGLSLGLPAGAAGGAIAAPNRTDAGDRKGGSR